MSGHLNSSPPFIDQHNEDQHSYLIFNSNLQASSSSSLSSRFIFNPTQDQSGYYHSGMQQSNNLASRGRSYHERSPGLELSLWKKEDINENENENNSFKWMSSKVRFMQKLKKSDHLVATDHVETPTITTQKCDDQKLPSSSSMEVHDNINCSIPVRVCADCNTTKTPLWRSGPRGPKSLCNACGIRQRKARRAMAAAANGTIVAAQASSKKTKVQHKDKKWNNGHAAHAQCKKSSKLSIQSDHGRKKLRFDDLLISLSENLAIHRVFPQDEKEAAILLMALSYGLVHG